MSEIGKDAKKKERQEMPFLDVIIYIGGYGVGGCVSGMLPTFLDETIGKSSGPSAMQQWVELYLIKLYHKLI